MAAVLTSFEQRLRDHIIDVLGLTEEDRQGMTHDTTFFADGLGIDSVDVLEVLVMIEREYRLRIPDRDRERAFADFGALAGYVEAALHAENGV